MIRIGLRRSRNWAIAPDDLPRSEEEQGTPHYVDSISPPLTPHLHPLCFCFRLSLSRSLEIKLMAVEQIKSSSPFESDPSILSSESTPPSKCDPEFDADQGDMGILSYSMELGMKELDCGSGVVSEDPGECGESLKSFLNSLRASLFEAEAHLGLVSPSACQKEKNVPHLASEHGLHDAVYGRGRCHSVDCLALKGVGGSEGSEPPPTSTNFLGKEQRPQTEETPAARGHLHLRKMEQTHDASTLHGSKRTQLPMLDESEAYLTSMDSGRSQSSIMLTAYPYQYSTHSISVVPLPNFQSGHILSVAPCMPYETPCANGRIRSAPVECVL